MNDTEALQTLKNALIAMDSEDLAAQLGDIDPKTRLDELGLDSVLFLEVVGSVEEQIGAEIPDERVATVQTVEDLIKEIVDR